MRGRLIDVRTISAGDEEAWRHLAERAVEPNPLGEPDCVIPAARHQPFGSEISLVVAEDQGRFQASVPVRPMRRWYNIRYPIAANKVRNATQVGTPLVDPADPTTAVATLLGTLAEHRRTLGCRLLGLDSLREGGPVATAVRAAAARLGLAVYTHEDFERAFLVRRTDATYGGGRSRSRRRELGRSRRLLEADFGVPPVLVDRSTDPSAIDEFIALEAAGYKSAVGVALAVLPGEAESFADMCDRYAESKRLLILALECRGITLGMQILVRGGDGLLGLKVSYDERYARYGPGVQLHAAAMEYFHFHTDARWLDTCASADNDFLMGLYPDRTRISTLLLSLHGPVDRMVVASLPSVRSLHRNWRTLAERTKGVVTTH